LHHENLAHSPPHPGKGLWAKTRPAETLTSADQKPGDELEELITGFREK